MMYFWNLGMLVRGGLSIGKLNHEENGALFGPAMSEACTLESKFAVYPRVVISQQASIRALRYDAISKCYASTFQEII